LKISYLPVHIEHTYEEEKKCDTIANKTTVHQSSNKKSKITKILNSEENSKRKVRNQMAISNDKSHQTNGYM